MIEEQLLCRPEVMEQAAGRKLSESVYLQFRKEGSAYVFNALRRDNRLFAKGCD